MLDAAGINRRLLALDHAMCVRLSHACLQGPVRGGFRIVSRLGDGVFWYALMLALLATYGRDAALPVVHMIAAGAAGTLIYKVLKRAISRPRPYQVHPDVLCAAPPLDRFSFPSGHTLHACAFGLVALACYPGLAWLVLPFILLVAASRIVLGLHYPSDVLAGAFIGSVLASASLNLF